MLYGGKLYFFEKHFGRGRAFTLRLGLVAATLFGIVRRLFGAFRWRIGTADLGAALVARWQLLWWLILPGRKRSRLNAGLAPTKVSILEP
jgi:hypothetical protein